jgi:hypothetical protein
MSIFTRYRRKYFTVEVEPEISPAIQHLNAFTANDLLFDWTAFKMPKGGSRLIGITAVVRSTDGDDQTCAMDLFFARQAVNMGDIANGTAPTSLGTLHADPTIIPNNPYWDQIMGHAKLTADNFSTAGAIESGITVGTTGYVASTGATAGLQAPNPLIFEDYGSGLADSEGLYTYYVGATAIGTPDFHSDLAFASGTGNDLTCDGTDARKLLAPGDRIKAIDIDDGSTVLDIGTVGTIPDGTSILLEGSTTSIDTLGDGDNIYNIHPIKLILSFEK